MTWKNIPDVYKALATIGIAATLGWGAHVWFGTQVGLPRVVAAQGDTLAVHSIRIDSLRFDLNDLARTNRQMLCMQIAERLRTPWQDCFK